MSYESKIPLGPAHASTSTAKMDGTPLPNEAVKGPTIRGFGSGMASGTTLGPDTMCGSGNGKGPVKGFSGGGLKAGKI